MYQGTYIFHLHLPVVGGSDGAGEVIEVGPKVTKFKKGDRVTTLFNPGHQSGPMTRAIMRNGSIGGSFDGTWQQYGVYEETWLVRLASNLSYLEGATLSDCGLTAWNALYGLKAVKPGDWVLVQGTGGVSLFAIQVTLQCSTSLINAKSNTNTSLQKQEGLKLSLQRHLPTNTSYCNALVLTILSTMLKIKTGD